MSFMARLPLRQKLTWLGMVCSISALIAAALALGAYEWVVYRRTVFSHLATLTDVTARNSTAAVAFVNAEDATRVLGALDSEPAVLEAALYDDRGRRIALFHRRARGIDYRSPALAPQDGLLSEGTELRLTVPVAESKRFGTLVVIADISGIWARVAAYGIVLACTIGLSAWLAYLLTGWLKERIVAPVQALAAAAARVQTNSDYSVRVDKEADDEVGALTDAFNAMLDHIQANEAEIARSAERLRLAVESAEIGTWDWDLLQDVVVWNARNYEIFAVQPGTKITGGLVARCINGDDRARVDAIVNAAMNAGGDFSTEFRTRPDRPDGMRYVALRGRFIPGAMGSSRRAVGVTLDITERRTAELRVIESELRFRAVAERAPAMIWSCDQSLYRDYFNKTWLAFTGRSLERELGDAWQSGVPAADLARWREIVGNAAAQHDPYSVEYRLRRADGDLRWVVETGSPRLAADGSFAGYLGSCIDITTRKENEEELETHVRLRTRELETANQELESFSYSVSHDLRGPVRAIQGFAEIALEELDANQLGAARERVERVVKASDRMNKLIDAFIGMARVSRAELRIETVNLTRLAEESVNFLRLAEPKRNVDVSIARGLTAQGDERLLRIALENLLGNAWKFTSRTARARIEFGVERRPEEEVFFVRDNGAGFDPALAHKLFRAFERLHSGSQFEGMGVGLNTVHRVIEKHAGRIWAQSRPGEGATFFFTLAVDPSSRRPAPV